MRGPRNEAMECAGLTLAVRCWGAEDAPVRVIALHGWLDNAAGFDPLARLLPDEVQIACVDFPGHGQSAWLPPFAEYHYVDWIGWCDRVAQRLGWARFSLLGHSMGAGVAALYAGTLPSSVERLVLLDGLGPYTTSAADAPANLAGALTERRRVGAREHRVFADVHQAIERKLIALPYLGQTCARLLMERGTRPVEGGVSYSHDPRLMGRSVLRFTEEQVLHFLRRIEAPTLIVRPREGLEYPDGHGDVATRVDAISPAEVLVVEGHHHVHLTDPDRIAAEVSAFLTQ